MKFATHSSARIALLSALALGITGCQGTAPTIGDTSAKTAATGSAGGANSQGENKQLEKCGETLGTVAVVEDTGSIWYQQMQSYNLRSTIPVLRLLIQQSNCFVVVERGAAMRNMNMERQLRDSGEMRSNSNMQKGQMVAADYTMNPTITFSQKGTSGLGGVLGGFGGGVLGAVAGSLKFNDASTVLTMIDNRSGVQLAAAEGSARNTDFAIFGGLGGGGAFGGLGGYTNTPEGKVLVAAFIDSYNQLVKSVRSYKAQEVKGGLGTGGRLGVQGGSTPASNEGSAPAAPAKKPAKKKTAQ